MKILLHCAGLQAATYVSFIRAKEKNSNALNYHIICSKRSQKQNLNSVDSQIEPSQQWYRISLVFQKKQSCQAIQGDTFWTFVFDKICISAMCKRNKRDEKMCYFLMSTVQDNTGKSTDILKLQCTKTIRSL